MGAVKIALLRPGAAAPSTLAARALWEARRLLRRLGWAASAGMAALLLAGFAAWQGQRLAQQQEALRAQIAQARAHSLAAPAPVVPDATRRLAAFQAYLPAHERIPELLKQLVGVAARSGVTLARADYKLLADGDGNGAPAFVRYQITLPVKAEFGRVQGFITGALHELPTLTLETVTFQRERIEAGEVEARLHFNLLLRAPVRKERAR